ncbi:P63C domain-containing protein [Gluconobacter oxydans]|uniref:P63C domain-containing protein n=1 Tax=Gluconobacter oxydans TaxID=442 RepID=UPI000A9F6071|nr:P63C domain-containing protein [Gluconobacter oxydans]
MSEKETMIYSHYRAPISQLGEGVEAYVLDEIDGQKQDRPRCVLSKRASAAALGLKSEGGSAFLRTFSRKGVGSAIDENLRFKIENPIVFKYLDPGSELLVHGYETSTFIEVLQALMKARRTGDLAPSQYFLAENAEMLLVALANTTLDTLVYQETGYWTVVEGQKISDILDKYLVDQARKWAKTFPDDFWFKLIKTKGYPSYLALKRPSFVGHWVNDLVYDRLAPGIREKLNKLNPRTDSGRRKKMHHQFTSEAHGLPELREHLVKVMAYMDVASSDQQFMRMMNKALPKFNTTYEMPFDED